MKNNPILWVVAVFLSVSFCCLADDFELGTAIEKKGETVVLTGSGYTRLSLVRFKTSITGTIYLNGILTVNRVPVSLVMWSKVNGKFYFSRMPGLQNVKRNQSMAFCIPFSSPRDPVTEVVLEVELPEGGEIILDKLGVSKG